MEADGGGDAPPPPPRRKKYSAFTGGRGTGRRGPSGRSPLSTQERAAMERAQAEVERFQKQLQDLAEQKSAAEQEAAASEKNLRQEVDQLRVKLEKAHAAGASEQDGLRTELEQALAAVKESQAARQAILDGQNAAATLRSSGSGRRALVALAKLEKQLHISGEESTVATAPQKETGWQWLSNRLHALTLAAASLEADRAERQRQVTHQSTMVDELREQLLRAESLRDESLAGAALAKVHMGARLLAAESCRAAAEAQLGDAASTALAAKLAICEADKAQLQRKLSEAETWLEILREQSNTTETPSSPEQSWPRHSDTEAADLNLELRESVAERADAQIGKLLSELSGSVDERGHGDDETGRSSDCSSETEDRPVARAQYYKVLAANGVVVRAAHDPSSERRPDLLHGDVVLAEEARLNPRDGSLRIRFQRKRRSNPLVAAGGWCNVIGADGRQLLEKCSPPLQSKQSDASVSTASDESHTQDESCDRRISLSAADRSLLKSDKNTSPSGWSGGDSAPLYAGECTKIERSTLSKGTLGLLDMVVATDRDAKRYFCLRPDGIEYYSAAADLLAKRPPKRRWPFTQIMEVREDDPREPATSPASASSALEAPPAQLAELDGAFSKGSTARTPHRKPQPVLPPASMTTQSIRSADFFVYHLRAADERSAGRWLHAIRVAHAAFVREGPWAGRGNQMRAALLQQVSDATVVAGIAAAETALRFAPRFKVMHEAVVRAGFDTNSAELLPLRVGQVVLALETRVNSSGFPRIRFVVEGSEADHSSKAKGWTNVVAADGTVLLQPQ